MWSNTIPFLHLLLLLHTTCIQGGRLRRSNEELYGKREDAPDVFARKFLNKATQFLSGRDFSMATSLFQRNFTCIGCERTYYYYEITLGLANWNKELDISFALQYAEEQKTVDWTKDFITFRATALNLGKEMSVCGAEFILGKYLQQLWAARAINCERCARSGFIDTSNNPSDNYLI